MANCDTQSGQLKRSVTSTYEPKRPRAPFLAMELVRGKGLDTMLSQGTVTRPDEGAWSAQICDALAHAHDAGIMHRYIKLSNILITPSGVAKVLDLGVARAADPYATADRLTQTGFIVGTPPYMAPEQARGLPEPRSDLYAVGCLLFELITGRLPFQAPDTVGYLSAHPTQEPRSTAVCCPFPRPSWRSFCSAPARPTWRPSTLPSQPSVLASAISRRRVCPVTCVCVEAVLRPIRQAAGSRGRAPRQSSGMAGLTRVPRVCAGAARRSRPVRGREELA